MGELTANVRGAYLKLGRSAFQKNYERIVPYLVHVRTEVERILQLGGLIEFL